MIGIAHNDANCDVLNPLVKNTALYEMSFFN